jgi:hypothetical protein
MYYVLEVGVEMSAEVRRTLRLRLEYFDYIFIMFIA